MVSGAAYRFESGAFSYPSVAQLMEFSADFREAGGLSPSARTMLFSYGDDRDRYEISVADCT